ncbi:MAG TPA: VWA domain-containing protein [Vicinamibacterales bacterium]|nr:VWA domain-containing protein [Vicinamibacterales bacterium]
MTQRLTVALLLAAMGGALAAQQQAAPQAPQPPVVDQPPVTFRVEVNYVEVDAFVTDAQGNVANDLTADDFDVFEDGKPQKVSSFSLVNIPIERAERPLFAGKPIVPDVQTNEHLEGRIYLMVLDDVHTDATRTPRVKAAARRFIEQNFGTNDLAAVVFTGRSDASQDFTNNSQLLIAAIEKFNGRKLRSSTIQRIESARVNPGTGVLEPGDDIDQMDRAFRARSVMANIRKLAEFMAGVRGRRKAMLLIGEGVDYNIYDATGLLGASASSVLLDTQDAIAAATRGNVSIYAIDPRGLTTGDEDLITQSGTVGDANGQSLQSELRLSQDSLRVLASSTGGFAAVNRNDLNGAFDRIVVENSGYYVFGYYSANDRRDGRFRKIEVRVKRPGLRVRSRSGYYEARGRKPSTSTSPTSMSPAIAEALGSPLPVAGIPIKAFAAPFKGAAPNAAVAFVAEVDVNQFEFIEKDGIFSEQLEIVNTATDSKGKVFPGDRQVVSLTMKPDTVARAKNRGFRLVSQASLPPGRYQMRIAVANREGKAGSVLYDLEVPDFSKGPLVMSGVALTSRLAAEAPTVKPKDPLADYLPGPPTAMREFSREDEIVLFAEFYENLPGAQVHSLDFKAELRAEGGRVVRSVEDQRSSSELKGASGGYGFSARLPLDDAEPGLYVIHVQGQARTGDQVTVSKDIQIRVR